MPQAFLEPLPGVAAVAALEIAVPAAEYNRSGAGFRPRWKAPFSCGGKCGQVAALSPGFASILGAKIALGSVPAYTMPRPFTRSDRLTVTD